MRNAPCGGSSGFGRVPCPGVTVPGLGAARDRGRQGSVAGTVVAPALKAEAVPLSLLPCLHFPSSAQLQGAPHGAGGFTFRV